MCRSNVTNTGFNAVLGSTMLLTSFSSNDSPSPCRLFCSKPFHSVPHRSMLHCNTHISFCSKFLHNIVLPTSILLVPFRVKLCHVRLFYQYSIFWNRSIPYQMAPCYIVTKHCILLEPIPFPVFPLWSNMQKRFFKLFIQLNFYSHHSIPSPTWLHQLLLISLPTFSQTIGSYI